MTWNRFTEPIFGLNPQTGKPDVNYSAKVSHTAWHPKKEGVIAVANQNAVYLYNSN